jgi:hypothetical protein
VAIGINWPVKIRGPLSEDFESTTEGARTETPKAPRGVRGRVSLSPFGTGLGEIFDVLKIG